MLGIGTAGINVFVQRGAIVVGVDIAVRIDRDTGRSRTPGYTRDNGRRRIGTTAARYDLDDGASALGRRIDVAGRVDRKGVDVVAGQTGPDIRRSI